MDAKTATVRISIEPGQVTPFQRACWEKFWSRLIDTRNKKPAVETGGLYGGCIIERSRES